MKIIKRLSSLCICFVVTLFSIVSMSVSASYYSTVSPYSTYTFNISSSIKDTCYNYDYWVLCCEKYSVSSTSNNYYLILVADQSEDVYGTEEGVLRFSTSSYPYDTKLNGLYSHHSGISTDYSQSCYLRCNTGSDENSDIWFYNKYFFQTDESYLNGFIFDNYNVDKFPIYEGETSNYTSMAILASNVDIYDYDNNLLQYGNYYTLLQYFNGSVDGSLITDYSGLETAPGVTESTESDSGGSSSDNEQLEVSNNILTNVKNLLETVFNLPQKIADAIGGFFTGLGDMLLEGLKTLFVPSDNLFIELIELIKSKFNFIFQLLEITDFLLEVDWIDSPPDATITFDGSVYLFGNFEVKIFDWGIIEPYRNLIRNLTTAIMWYFFIRKVIKRLPDIINGVSSGGA